MDYDVLILGGGTVGCTVAYELSKYNLNIALIEKDNDILEDISLINTSVVYDGTESNNKVIYNYERIGYKLIKEISKKFNIPYKKVGELRVASDDYGMFKLNKIYEAANKRGEKNISLLNREEVLELESNIKIDVKQGLYLEEVAIVSPYELLIACAEVSSDNGVNFRFEENVVSISKISKGFKVITNKNTFKCKIIINTTQLDISKEENNREKWDNIKIPKNNKYINYITINKDIKAPLSKVVINESKEIINIPSIYEGYIVGIENKDILSYEKRIQLSKGLIPTINQEVANNMFNYTYNKDTIFRNYDNFKEGYIKVTGINYINIGIAPAISKNISKVVVDYIKATLKKDFIDKRRDVYKFKTMNNTEKNKLISINEKYGKIVCLCNQITEGEIVDAIRRPLGARTLDGIKRRTGACSGSCKGSYCNRIIINILAREMGKNVTEIVKNSKNNAIWSGRIKEFDSV